MTFFFFLDLLNSEGGRGSQHDSASGERILFLSHVGAWLFHGPLTANLIHTEQSSLHSTCQCCIEAVTRLQCTSHNTVPVGVREAAWSQIHILWALDERVTWKMVCLFVRVPQVKKKTNKKLWGWPYVGWDCCLRNRFPTPVHTVIVRAQCCPPP